MDKHLIDEAISSLELLTIRLHTSLLERKEDFIGSSTEANGEIQSMRRIKTFRLKGQVDGEQDVDVFRVLVTLGIRMIEGDRSQPSETEEPDEEKIYFKVEATFRADYRIKSDVSKGALSEFARYNSVHNVWPYWREFVTNTALRADLPNIKIGFFAM